MMSEDQLSETERSENPLDLAAPIIERVEIQSIFLAESRTLRHPQANLCQGGLRSDVTVAKVEVGRNEESKSIYVCPEFRLTISTEGGAEATLLLSIDAKFVLIYSLQSFDGLEDKNLKAFGTTNGVFNAWPYWREFVQAMTTRMGLQSLTVPLFRLAKLATSSDPPLPQPQTLATETRQDR